MYINKLENHNIEETANLLAESFHGNPIYSFISGPKNSVIKLEKLFKAALTFIMEIDGKTIVLKDTEGFIIGTYSILPSDINILAFKALVKFLFSIMSRINILVMFKVIYITATQIPFLPKKTNNRTFCLLAVRKKERNRGMGQLLLDDALKKLAYLLLLTQEKKCFFEKRGFTLIKTQRILGINNYLFSKSVSNSFN